MSARTTRPDVGGGAEVVTNERREIGPSAASVETPRAHGAEQWRRGTAIGRALERWLERSWLAYGTLLALQLKVVWDIWARRDLTLGDTAWYFTYAWSWYDHLGDIVCWSPLYTSLYGSFLHLSTDAWVATVAHRLLIVFVLAALVLALMRRLLPAPIAWLAAAWWVIVPIHYDAIYEVHIFAVIPVVIGALVILVGNGPWARGGALGILVATTFLMRNELMIAVAVLAVCVLAAERRDWYRTDSHDRSAWIRTRGRAYALPLLGAAALVLVFYLRSDVKFPELSAAIARKHTLNVCQIYAFTYRQRHPEWNKSEWSQCQELMQRDFGAPEVTLTAAIHRNPRAILDHFAWNIQHFPVGLQTVLFDVTSGTVNPEYAPFRPLLAMTLSVALCVLLAAGAVVGWRRRQQLWDQWLRARIWGWLYLLAVDGTVLFVMVMQRPRPNYMFALALSIIAAAGTALMILIPPRRLADFSVLAAVGALCLLIVAPTYYNRSQARVIAGHSRPLMVAYRRLRPFDALFSAPGRGLLAPYDAAELCEYLGRRAYHTCYGVPFDAVDTDRLAATLDEHKIDLVYLDDREPRSHAIAEGLRQLSAEWRTVGLGEDHEGSWSLLQRSTAPAAADSSPH